MHNRPRRVKVRILITPKRQICQNCNKEKPIAEFAAHKGRKKGHYRKTCKECDLKYDSQKAAEWRNRNPEKALEVGRRSDAKRSNRSKTDERIAYMHDYYGKHDAVFKDRARAWGRANPKKVLANTVARQEKIRRATPTWTDMREIAQIYENCPAEHHVDHVVPIGGITAEGYRVSGLHVPWNLQYLSEFENCSKNNRMTAAEQAMCESAIF